MSRVPTTNKVIITYTNGQTYTFPRVNNFEVASDGKNVFVEYVERNVSKKEVKETISLTNVSLVTFRQKRDIGKTEYVVKGGYVREVVKTCPYKAPTFLRVSSMSPIEIGHHIHYR